MNRRKHPLGMGTFKRGLVISPFQIPLLVFLTIEGILLCLGAPGIAAQLSTHGHTVPAWSIVNLGALLVVGGALATYSRFNDNERQESFGLLLVLLAVVISAAISVFARDYQIGDEVAIGLGCWLRNRVLLKAMKAERVAIKITEKNNEEEKP